MLFSINWNMAKMFNNFLNFSGMSKKEEAQIPESTPTNPDFNNHYDMSADCVVQPTNLDVEHSFW